VFHCNVEQLRWWLINGNKNVAITKDSLPYMGADMTDINNDGVITDKIFDQVCADDRKEGLLLDSAMPVDILDDADGIIALDALVIPYNKIQRKMNQMMGILKIVADDKVKPVALQVTEPFKQKGTTNVAAVIELEDGQTVSIFFHNNDITPQKITPTDMLVSWKWVLNKKDVTIVVAPEQGKDINIREVSRRIMQLASKNSDRFIKANAKKAERLQAIEEKQSGITAKEKELDTLNKDIIYLEDLKAKQGSGAEVDKVMSSSEFRAARKKLSSSMGVIMRIDAGMEKGMTRSLFVSSMTGAMRTIAKNESAMFTGLLLAFIAKTQLNFKKKIITPRNGIWKLAPDYEQYMDKFDAFEDIPSKNADNQKLQEMIVNKQVVKPEPEPEPAPVEPEGAASYFDRLLEIAKGLADRGWQMSDNYELFTLINGKVEFRIIHDYTQGSGLKNVTWEAFGDGNPLGSPILDDRKPSPDSIASAIHAEAMLGMPKKAEDNTGFNVGDTVYAYVEATEKIEELNYRGLQPDDSNYAVVVRDGFQMALPVSTLMKEMPKFNKGDNVKTSTGKTGTVVGVRHTEHIVVDYGNGLRDTYRQDQLEIAPEADLSDDPDTAFLDMVISGGADFYDKNIMDKLAEIAKNNSNPEIVEKLKTAKTMAKEFFMGEFTKKTS
jgi:hypothetical protein